MKKDDSKGYAKMLNARISPRKVGLMANAIRDKNANDALGYLKNMNLRSSSVLGKLLHSAISNALDKDQNCSVDRLYITGIHVSKGMTMKRMRPRAMGRGFLIRKKMSHIQIKLNYLEN